MTAMLRKIILMIALIFTVLFIIFVINQTNQVVTLASGINIYFGRTVLYTLLTFYALIIIVPLYAILSRPPGLIPPVEAEGDEYQRYIKKLVKRLSRNPHLKEIELDSEKPDLETLEKALKTLNKEADLKIKEAASGVFIMTAISQYGALDALIVVLAQFRMIWQVSSVYNQRPNLRELLYLYSNVFATAFLATRIENLEILEDQLEPVIASVMGSSLSAFTPALNTAANIITNSVIQGSANAFLTLRVGIIARQYCSAITRPEKISLISNASIQASTMLAIVLGDSTYKVTRAVLKATAKAGKRPFRYGQGLVTGASQKTWEAGKSTFRKSEDMAKSLGKAIKDSGKKFKFYFVKPEITDEPETD